MKGRTRWVIFPGLALPLLTLLFSCSWISGDAGAQIAINIANYATRAIGVTEYEVTGLEIEVFDPAGMPLEEFEWDPGDGATQYLIPVRQSGQHQVVVTHIGNGGAFEAVESSFFDIEPMVVTVITIVPGMIGVIQVEGEGEEPCRCCDMVGTWTGLNPVPTPDGSLPVLPVEMEFFADGTASITMYEYEGGPPLEFGVMRGTYICDGDIIDGIWTEIYMEGMWIPMDLVADWIARTLEWTGDSWIIEIDFEQDGSFDVTWILYRQ